MYPTCKLQWIYNIHASKNQNQLAYKFYEKEKLRCEKYIYSYRCKW